MKFLQIVYINIAQIDTKYFAFLTLPVFCGTSSLSILRIHCQTRVPAGKKLLPEFVLGRRLRKYKLSKSA